MDLRILSPSVFWYSAVILIVAGHATAVFVPHLEAQRLFGERRKALLSQLPMVVLMIAYAAPSPFLRADS